MSTKIALLGQRKKIALIAHDNKKADLLEWVKFNRGTLLQHELLVKAEKKKICQCPFQGCVPLSALSLRKFMACSTDFANPSRLSNAAIV
jgi:hypothetical protein